MACDFCSRAGRQLNQPPWNKYTAKAMGDDIVGEKRMPSPLVLRTALNSRAEWRAGRNAVYQLAALTIGSRRRIRAEWR
jgi:hypothetical protein